jgi:ssDNA thymidine ADP-ribosyltransferase, DarT
VSELEAIRAEAERRTITRLAHFTPTRNLVHIATGKGLLSTMELEKHRDAFNQQDLERLDGFPDHISCGIEYPNSYYVRRKRRNARGEERLFPDWVCLLIEPHYLWHEDTLLCPHNAAGACGTAVRGGLECFESMFADQVEAPQRTWHRADHPDCCPTDAQAEVLVHRFIPLEDVQAIAVETTDQARDTYARLRQLGAPVEQLPFIIAPAFYEPTGLAVGLSRAQRPVESPWHPPADGDGAHESGG